MPGIIRKIIIDSQSHITIFDIDDRYRQLTNLQDITNGQVEFVKMHHEPPCITVNEFAEDARTRL